jgi:hypothetical protein
MAFNINQFKSELQYGGARPTLFQCEITNPPGINLGNGVEKFPFMARAAGIPESQVGQYIVPYFGRQVKYAGDRIFADWTVTIINDEDFAVRNSIEKWLDFINSHDSNTRALPQNYKTDGIIKQYAKGGDQPIRVYRFEGMFPIAADAIQMGWDQVDQIEEFNVTFQYDLWRVEGNESDITT